MDPTESIFSSSTLRTVLVPYILAALAWVFGRDVTSNADVQTIVPALATVGAVGLHAIVLWVRGRMHLTVAAATPQQTASVFLPGVLTSTTPPGETIPLAQAVAEHEANASKANPRSRRSAKP